MKKVLIDTQCSKPEMPSVCENNKPDYRRHYEVIYNNENYNTGKTLALAGNKIPRLLVIISAVFINQSYI